MAYLHGEVNDASINAWADVCAAKGWTRMEITGSEAFKARAWLELRSRGIEVTNYEPAPHIREEYERMTAGGGPSDPPALPAPDWLEELGHQLRRRQPQARCYQRKVRQPVRWQALQRHLRQCHQ